MNTYLAVFKSKAEVFAFVEQMQNRGIYAVAVSTPKQAKIGCGLSAKFNENGLGVAKRIIGFGNFRSFYGLYRLYFEYGIERAERIY